MEIGKNLETFNYIYIEDKKIDLTKLHSTIKEKNLGLNESAEIFVNGYKIDVNKKNKIYYIINIYKNIQNQFNHLGYLEILIKPTKINFQDQLFNILIIEQFNELPILLNLKRPTLYCINHSEKIPYQFGDFISHYNSHKNLLFTIMLNEKLTIDDKMKEDDFNNFFEKIKNKSEFKNIKDFEINYKNYFDINDYQDEENEFEFYDDDENYRVLMISNLCSHNLIFGHLSIYYGLPGMGKSITLIQTFKYKYNHINIGTFYIHCKSIQSYYINNFSIMKKILKDEIIYLFQNEYNQYQKCINYIDNLAQDENNNNFWNIINNIIKNYCNNKSKKYVFIFDQYNYESDLNEELYKLNAFLKNKDNQYGIIVCCSLNTENVRNLKIQNLFEESEIEIADNINIKEIKKLFDISNFSIDKNNIYDKTLEKIGKTVKNYNILKKFYQEQDSKGLEKYIINLKTRIYQNLLEFFGLDNQANIIKTKLDKKSHLIPILSFNVDTKYKNEYILKIKNNIPFKYFDIQKIDKNYSQIVFNFPLVGEVMTKIYELIIIGNKSLFSIFNRLDLDEGALGGLYEKYVINSMEPDKYKKRKILFNYFEIKGIEIVDKFVPKKKEKYEFKKYNIKSLSDGDYLFKQEQFNGKAFDCAIIRIKNNIAKVFFFQISLNKKYIYTIKDLIKFIDSFINYFSFQYKFKIYMENVYFTYIFDIKNKNILYEKCEKNDIKCMFFTPSTKQFTYFDDYLIENIRDENEIFINPNDLYNKEDIIMMESNKIKYKKNKICININDIKKRNILQLWMEIFPEFSNKKLDLKFSHNINDIDESYLNDSIMYLRELKFYESEEWIKVINMDTEKKTEKEESKKKELIKELKQLKANNLKNKIKNKNSIVLIIYKKINLFFGLISDNVVINSVKYLPISKNGIKFYDVFNIDIINDQNK